MDSSPDNEEAFVKIRKRTLGIACFVNFAAMAGLASIAAVARGSSCSCDAVSAQIASEGVPCNNAPPTGQPSSIVRWVEPSAWPTLATEPTLSPLDQHSTPTDLTRTPTTSPTSVPTGSPTSIPTGSPTGSPTSGPTGSPTGSPTSIRTSSPISSPTSSPTEKPTLSPTSSPISSLPGDDSTGLPTGPVPTELPTRFPTMLPTLRPTLPVIEGCFNSRVALDDAINAWYNSETLREVFRLQYGPMEDWCFGPQVQDMSSLFEGLGRFNEDIGNWSVSFVTSMKRMFDGAYQFTGDNIGRWDVSSVQDMDGMFWGATSFNGNVGSWNVSSVVRMSSMFRKAAAFHQDIGSWDVSSVLSMRSMFEQAQQFNHPAIRQWNVASVVNMGGMFSSLPYTYRLQNQFNQDISIWNVRSVRNMAGMFSSATSFNQDLCAWGPQLDASVVTEGMFHLTNCSETIEPLFSLDPPGPFCQICT